MRDTAQVLEDMINSITTGNKYGVDPRSLKLRRRTVPASYEVLEKGTKLAEKRHMEEEALKAK